MEDKKEKLEGLLTALDNLKETMTHTIDELSTRVENALKEANEKSKEIRFIPFDVEKAKQGAKVVTKDNGTVRILCYDRKSNTYPIVALVLQPDKDKDEEEVVSYTNDGKDYPDDTSLYDLMIEEECV